MATISQLIVTLITYPFDISNDLVELPKKAIITQLFDAVRLHRREARSPFEQLYSNGCAWQMLTTANDRVVIRGPQIEPGEVRVKCEWNATVSIGIENEV